MPFIELDVVTKTEKWNMTNMHHHPYYEIYYLTEGERNLVVNNNIYNFKRETIIVLPPYVMHKTDGKPFTRINVNVSTDYFTKEQLEIVDLISYYGPIELKSEQSKTIHFIFDKIFEYYKKIPQNMAAESVRIYLLFLFVTLREYARQNDEHEKNHKLKQYPLILINIIKYLSDNISSDVSVKTLSEKFYLSQGYISKLFKKYTNTTISDYVLTMRMTAAKRLLKETKKSMEEISYLTGFSSSNYFSLIFKKKNNISPMAYRKQFL